MRVRCKRPHCFSGQHFSHCLPIRAQSHVPVLDNWSTEENLLLQTEVMTMSRCWKAGRDKKLSPGICSHERDGGISNLMSL